MTLRSWLPEGGENLFQRIKKQRAKAEEAGIKIFDMSIGQPQGPALISARWAASEAIRSSDMVMHEYQDNGSPGCPDFAQRFVEAHLGFRIGEMGYNVAFLPIPGIKPMLGLIPLACGVRGGKGVHTTLLTTNPGYPTPKDWCDYWGMKIAAPALAPDNEFRFDMREHIDWPWRIDLAMINYPHNPSGQVATKEWLREICDLCATSGTRLFNDGAYLALRHTDEGVSLAEVAVEFPELSWMEAYSASKSIANGTGWRVGAMVGSPDFIADLARVKGNADSGFTAPQAVGALYAMENDQEGVRANARKYWGRIHTLINVLHSQMMELAVPPQAGFFTLWLAPKKAFGQETPDGEAFNAVMIEKAGVVGVPFGPYIRYSVCGDIEAMAPDIARVFKEADISYD